MCIVWLLQRAWLHSERCLCQGQSGSPTHQRCNPFSCHRSSTKWTIWDQEAAMQPRHRRGHWPGSSCCILAWHRFRGFCAAQTELLSLPLRRHLREGIVWFMRWEEKIKLPRCLSFGMKRKKRVLLFLVSKECSLHIAFKGRKGSVEAGCPKRCTSGRALSQSWVTLSQAVQQNVAAGAGHPHPAVTWGLSGKGTTLAGQALPPPSCGSTLPFCGVLRKSMRCFV